MINVALTYLRHRWSVLPVHHVVRGYCTCGNDDCPTPGKHPAIQWTDYAKRLPTLKEVRSWFLEEFEGANIGIATGLVSNLVVVDLDGELGIRTAENELDLPLQTLASRTGGGGLHLFYKANGVKIQTRVKILPGVDVRAERGFVVAPPSIHESGNIYKWVNKVKPISCDLSVLNTLNPEGSVEFGTEDKWYSELRAGVEEGMRSNAASRLAGRYFGLGMDTDEVWEMLSSWNTRNHPPLSNTELATTVKWAYGKHEESRREKEIQSLNDISGLLPGKEDNK